LVTIIIDNLVLEDWRPSRAYLKLFFDRGVHPNPVISLTGSTVLELLLCLPFAHIGVVMITTIACVAGFFIGFTTHLMLTQLAKRRKVEVIRVGSSWQVYK